jgi:hypothetical protein
MKRLAATAAVEHYEALRQSAMAPAQERIFSADPLGAILVMKTGVAGWMHRWREAVAAPARSAPAPAYPNLCDTPGWQHELTLLLAQMSVRHLSGAEAL